jgi:hypothetical protein
MVNRICSAAAFFLNALAIASGSNVLASYAPHWSNYTQDEVWSQAGNYLYGEVVFQSGDYEIVPEMEESISYESFAAMQDLIGAVWGKMHEYTRAGDFGANGVIAVHGHTLKVQALFSVIMHNNWARHYEGTQGHLQAIFSLLFTWQFQYKPYEPKRNPAQVDTYKTIVKTGRVTSQYNKRFWELYNSVKMPELQGRIMTDVPRFAPWRTWQVEIPFPDVETVYQEAVRQEEIDRYNAKMAAIKQEREDFITERGLRYQEWLKKRLKQIKDANNALDTPSEIDVAADVFNLSPRVKNGLKRLEPVVGIVKDVVYPHRILRRGIKSTLVRRVVITAKNKSKKIALDELKKNAKDRVFDALDPNASRYEERDFWPDGDETPNFTIPPYDPYVLPPEGSGGGVTW